MEILFYDDEHIAAESGFARVPGRAQKLGPVDGGIDPEWAYDVFSGSVAVLPDGRFWVYSTACCKTDLNRTGLYIHESSDGINWHPVGKVRLENIPEGFEGYFKQPSIIQKSAGDFEMYVWCHGVVGGRLISRNLRARSDNGIEFKIEDFDSPVLYHPNEFGEWRTEDGLLLLNDLTELKSQQADPATLLRFKQMRTNDSTCFYFDRELKKYILYHVNFLSNPKGNPRRVEYDNAKSLLRVVCRRTSSDGRVFSDPEIVMMPDEKDPMDQQFYYLARAKRGRWNVGFVGDYKVADQTMDLTLAFSRDGISWLRPARSPLLEREEGNFDAKNIYACDSPLEIGDDWLILYRGGSELHKAGWLSCCNSRMALARIRKDRLLGLDSRHDAYLWTRGFIVTRPEIVLNADVRGSLKAELCDPFGNPLPGFSRNDFMEITGDDFQFHLKWKNQETDKLQFECASLRLEINDGTLYSLNV